MKKLHLPFRIGPICFKAMLGFVCSAVILPLIALSDGYEQPPVLSASKILSKELLRGKYHRVQERVSNDGYLNLYVIDSDFGRFEARGRFMLARRVNEILILAELKKIASSKVFVDSAKKVGIDIVTAPIRTIEKAYELVTEPGKMIETAQALPEGVFNLFKTASRFAQKGYEAVSGDSSISSNTSEEDDSTKGNAEAAVNWAEKYGDDYLGYSKRLREWQKKYGIDPYTTNTVMHDELKRIVRVETAVGVGGRFMPGIVGTPYVGKLVSTAEAAQRLAIYEDPVELEKRHTAELQALGGVSEPSVKRFLTHPFITPSYRAVLLDALKEMKGVNDRGAYIAISSLAKGEVGAAFYTQAVQQMAQYHRSVEPLREVIGAVALPAAVSRSGKLVLFIPVDLLLWTEEVASFFPQLRSQLGKGRSLSAVELRFSGELSSRCRAELAGAGIEVVKIPSR